MKRSAVIAMTASIVITTVTSPAMAFERDHMTFTDDDGHPAELAFEHLGSVGVITGCNPPANSRICPDASVTRAQAA